MDQFTSNSEPYNPNRSKYGLGFQSLIWILADLLNTFFEFNSNFDTRIEDDVQPRLCYPSSIEFNFKHEQNVYDQLFKII